MNDAPPQLPEGVIARARAIYRLSDKPDDFVWARYFTRPYCALFLSLGDRLPWTPNLISYLSLLVGFAAAAVFAFWAGLAGLWIGWALVHLSYTLDCMDGMQARAKHQYSPCGTQLDFLVDAIKQVFLFSAIGFRLWIEGGMPTSWPEGWPLYLTLVGTPSVATGLAITTFLRSPEVTGKAEQEHRARRDASLSGRIMAVVGFLMNYPSWILVPVIFNRMDVFLLITIPLYVAYAGYASLLVLVRVCLPDHYARSHPGTAQPAPEG